MGGNPIAGVAARAAPERVICVRPRVWPTDARCPGWIRPSALNPRTRALGASPTTAVMILLG